MPHGVAVLTAGVQRDHQENAAELVQLVQLVREQVGPVANFKQVAIVSRLPKARSEKVLRGTMRQIADAQPYQMPATIDDPLVPDAIKAVLRGLGYAGESKPQIGDWPSASRVPCRPRLTT